MDNFTLITGGARSGKSEFAEKLASHFNKPVTYVATMIDPVKNKNCTGHTDYDFELVNRIELHKKRRPKSWQTIETDQFLQESMTLLPSGESVCLIDCLSCYIANIFGDERLVEEQTDLFLEYVEKHKEIDFILVTSEVGWSIVPDNALSRRYRDILGEVNAKMARRAGTVWLSCVGLQIKLK